MDAIDLSAFESLLRGSPGLLIGPSQTVSPQHCTDIETFLKEKYSSDGATLRSIVDSIIATSANTEEQIRKEVAAFCNTAHPAPQLAQFAKVRWSAILSASPDIFLEKAMQIEEEKRPGRRSVYIGYDLSMPLPSRDIPVFKMLGTHVRHDFCLSTASYYQRRNQWRLVIPTFTERVAGNPVLCLGMGSLTDSVLLDIISEFVAGRSSAPSHLILLGNDPLIANPQLPAILGSRTKLLRVQASISQVVQCVSAAALKNFPHQLGTGMLPDDGMNHLLRFDDIATVVNLRVKPRLREDEKLALRELLFSPSVHEWDSYAYGLDFKRTVTNGVMQLFVAATTSTRKLDHAFVIMGNSASGKTTILKRLAFEVAKLGPLVLWHKPTFVPDAGRRLKQLFDELGKCPAVKNQPLYYFIDDPVAGSTSVVNLISAIAASARVRVFVVLGIRSSDWLTLGKTDIVSQFSEYTPVEVPDSLDEIEEAALPQYLVDLEIFSDVKDAGISCKVLTIKYTRDTLSLLYWLLPQTRVAIASSIQEEFFRLGDTAGFRKMILADNAASTQLLRDAYEMVAVAAHYEVPLPVELLVSALEVDYGAWLNAAAEHGAAWGILYSVYSEDNSERYTTRNDVVTGLLIEAINGGSQLRGGELKVLRKLISSCAGHAGPVYREFCVRLLVPHQQLMNRLDYQEGLSLYDLAIESLSHPDQSILHHKGLWIKNKGRRPVEAATVLEKALITPVYPYSDRGEATEHIHTSLAATKLDAIDSGDLTWEQGKIEAIDHLQRARSQTFFNPKAVHVEARIATRIIARAVSEDFGDACEVANRSLADIDRTLELVRNPVSVGHHLSNSTQYLERARQDVISALSNGRDIQALADDIWTKFNAQSGFIVAARMLLHAARENGRDKSYRKADDYCQTVRGKITAAKLAVIPELAEVQLHICYEAYVVRRLMSSGHNSIDWVRLEQLAIEAGMGTDPARSPMIRFIMAIARAHQGDWTGANAQFASLRKVHMSTEAMWRPRALLLADQGGARQVQGKIREVINERYLFVDELQAEVKCARGGRWPKDGEIAHAYIEFAFAGPSATDSLH